MKLLFVNGCISQRGSDSRTRALCQAFLTAWQAARPDGVVETVDLTVKTPPLLTPELLDRRDALARAGTFEDPLFDLARQFQQADRIVVGAPFWDLCFPAQLQAYIGHICANGVNYYYDAAGSHGASRAKRLCYLTSGGDQESPHSLGVEYWRQLCGLFGILEFRYVFAGGLDLDPAETPQLLAGACEEARRLAAKF